METVWMSPELADAIFSGPVCRRFFHPENQPYYTLVGISAGEGWATRSVDRVFYTRIARFAIKFSRGF